MGYSRCAVPSCSSRPSTGKLFKYWPKSESQQSAWLRAIPNWVILDTDKENASRRIAVCEDHFKPTDFELGAYGKRKLSSFAVPSLFVPAPASPVRRALGDVTNANHCNSPKEAYPPTGIESKSFSPGSHEKSDNLPVNSPLHTSTPRPKASKILSFLDEGTGETEAFLLDEKTGLLRPVTSGSAHTAVKHGCVTLCEETGVFRPAINETRDDFSIETFLEQQSILENLADSLETTVSHQDVQIAALLEEQRQKDQIIEEQKRLLSNLEVEAGNFSKHCKSIMRSKQRASKKLKSFGSAWLEESQIARLARRNRRGVKWTTEETRQGLILKMKSGTSAYSDWVSKFPILPSVRSLQEAVQFIRFDAGLLLEMFDLLECLSKKLPDIEKDCQIVLHEMQLEEGPKFDNSLKKVVGNATLPGHTGVAKKALVFIIAGISRRWKVPVAVEFTSEKAKDLRKAKHNTTGEAYKKIIDEVVFKSEKSGLYVCSVTSDMGPDNLAFWKTCAVSTGRKGDVKHCFPNPVRQGEQVTILCDAVHLLKGTKTMLESNMIIELPADVVEAERLSSPFVNYAHIEELMEFESGNELRVAFRLRQENVHCKKQFKKMNVGTTKAVVCHRTGVGLNMLAQEKNDPKYETTGWFIILMNTFYALATCRHRGMAISKHNPVAYQKAIDLIKKVAYIFTVMKVGHDGSFKPVQRGMRILCSGYLYLIEYFLERRGYQYLMLGRFTGDCIENMFSLIRLAQAIPNALLFLQSLKVVALAQFSQAVKGSSYDYDESSPISEDFLEEARKRAKERASQRFYDSLEELMANPIRVLTEQDLSVMGDWEKAVVYDMAGAVFAAILKSNQKVCDLCISSVKWQDKEKPHPASLITEMKEFTLLRSDDGERALQISVSDAVFKGILITEMTFRLYREAAVSFKNTDVKQYFVEQLMYVWNGAGLPECHSIGRKILNTYLHGRLKEYGKLLKEQLKIQETTQRSSKSVAMRQAANQMTVASGVK